MSTGPGDRHVDAEVRLTLQTVVKRNLAHDLLILAALERVGSVRMEEVVRDAVEGVGVKAWRALGLGRDRGRLGGLAGTDISVASKVSIYSGPLPAGRTYIEIEAAADGLGTLADKVGRPLGNAVEGRAPDNVGVCVAVGQDTLSPGMLEPSHLVRLWAVMGCPWRPPRLTSSLFKIVNMVLKETSSAC